MRKIRSKCVCAVITCIVFMLFCGVLYLEFNTDARTKYQILTEPLHDGISYRRKLDPATLLKDRLDINKMVEDINAGAYSVTSRPTPETSVVTQIDPTMLSMIEDIEKRDNTRNNSVILEGIGNYSCPQQLRVVNGVEDLLCMVKG